MLKAVCLSLFVGATAGVVYAFLVVASNYPLVSAVAHVGGK